MIRFPLPSLPRFRPLGYITAFPLLFAVVSCAKPDAPADFVEIVGATSTCTGCRIELGPPLELRSEKSSEFPFAISQPAISVDGQGRFWVAEIERPALVYDAKGMFLRTLDHKDSSASDFGRPSAFLPLPGDSMLVFAFDSANGNRAIVVDSLFHAARTVRLPGVLMPASAEGWPARLVLSGPLKGDSTEGEILHAGSAEQSEFKIESSFGPGKLRSAEIGTVANYQRTTPGKDSTFWSSDILRYRISHFSNDGTLIGTIERTPSWFPVPSVDNMGTPTAPPPPKIFAIWQAPDGLLWVFGRVAGKQWQQGWPKLAPSAKRLSVLAMHFDKLFGTTIEVLDPVTRNVIATAPLDEYITNVLPNGNVAVYSVDSAGAPHLAIRRLPLSR